MSEPMAALYVFVLACFIGYWVIWNVTPSLHTPLISLTNAISGIVIVGALLVAGFEDKGVVGAVIGFTAVLLASINIFGGFLVTQRMLQMFKKKKK
jgi:H+-translocating NAD(P) transhydrogenase subunit alpha